ncbi:MAG: GNAT family N-acetyltransferase [Clostridia bacterium]|nr:GNAT family N-acetyltransferase [Clostridia bacterium]
MVREIERTELNDLLALYTHLHEKSIPEWSDHLKHTWETILQDRNHHIIVNIVDGKLVSSCVCVVIPNLTRGIRPYALIENVVTHSDHRGMGYATACLDYAKALAEREHCYKIMLLTGSRDAATLRFYERAGYNSREKTAFTQRLE